jgi:hypothetical protein
MKCAITDCENEVVWSGKGRRSKYCSEACKQKAKRVRASEKRVKRMREQRSKLYIVPVSLERANAFVSLLHRHNKVVPGAKFCLGVIDEQGMLRGVAIIGRPVARLLDDGLTLEVNRVATDGSPNACSALYAAARKTAFAMGYKRLITYTLQEESGASMRGAGWKRAAETQASPTGWLNRAGRKVQAVYQSNKWRWETLNPEFLRDRQRPTLLATQEMQVSSGDEQLTLLEVTR